VKRLYQTPAFPLPFHATSHAHRRTECDRSVRRGSVPEKLKKVVFAKRTQIFGAALEPNLQRFQGVVRFEDGASARKEAQKNGQNIAKFAKIPMIFCKISVVSRAI
jgi:hypothetical protein